MDQLPRKRLKWTGELWRRRYSVKNHCWLVGWLVGCSTELVLQMRQEAEERERQEKADADETALRAQRQAEWVSATSYVASYPGSWVRGY